MILTGNSPYPLHFLFFTCISSPSPIIIPSPLPIAHCPLILFSFICEKKQLPYVWIFLLKKISPIYRSYKIIPSIDSGICVWRILGLIYFYNLSNNLFNRLKLILCLTQLFYKQFFLLLKLFWVTNIYLKYQMSS